MFEDDILVISIGMADEFADCFGVDDEVVEGGEMVVERGKQW